MGSVCAYLCISAFRSNCQIVCIRKVYLGPESTLIKKKIKIATSKEPLLLFKNFSHLEIYSYYQGCCFQGLLSGGFVFYFSVYYCMVQAKSFFTKVCVKVEEYLRILVSVSSQGIRQSSLVIFSHSKHYNGMNVTLPVCFLF